MNLLFVLLLSLVTIALSQNGADFSADYEITSSLVSGVLRGRLHYSTSQKSVLFIQEDGYKDLSVYSTDSNARMRYYDCASGCQIEAIAADNIFPNFLHSNTDNCDSSPTNGCFECSRSDSSNVIGVCVADLSSNEVVSISYNDGGEDKTIKLSNRGALTSNSVFTVPDQCELNCRAVLDIVLVIDESNSIDGNYNPDLTPPVNSGEWKLQREFAIDFVNSFEIASDKIHMGLVQFSKGSRKVMPAPHIISNSGTFNNVIQGLTKNLCGSDPRNWNSNRGCRGQTWTGHGLIDAINILEDTSGARALRANVGKVIVIITDGKSYYGGSSSFTYDGQTFAHPQGWIDYVKGKDITIISVGVGSGVDQAQLEAFSSVGADGNPLVFLAANFDSLSARDLILSLGHSVCVADGTPAACQGRCQGSCQCGECKCPTSCDTNDVCLTGSCSANSLRGGCVYEDVDCDEGNACKVYSCDSVAGCQQADLNCDDGNPCTIDDCDPDRGCTHIPVVCSTDFCTNSTCNLQTGDCSAPTVSTVCQSDNLCTVSDCTSGTCVFTFTSECDLGDACMAYGCDPDTGCTAAPLACDDGNECTDTSCLDGNCLLAPIDCDDNNDCTVDTCDTATGCVHTPVDCDDGLICTVDTCEENGGCRNDPIECPSTNADGCIVGACDPFDGCKDVERDCSLEVPDDELINCTISLCTEGECSFGQTEVCQNSELLIAAVATGSVVVIILIVAGIVACLGTTAGVTYGTIQVVNPELFQGSGIYEADTTVKNSGIYQGDQTPR